MLLVLLVAIEGVALGCRPVRLVSLCSVLRPLWSPALVTQNV